MKKFKNTLSSAALKRQSRSEASILEMEQLDLDPALENFDYQNEMKVFFENIRGGGLSAKAVEVVSKVFKEFGVKDLDKLVANEPMKSNNSEEFADGDNGKTKKRAKSLKSLLKDHVKQPGLGKRGRPRKIDKDLQIEGLMTKEEKKEASAEQDMNQKEDNKSFGQKVKKFIVEGERKQDEADLSVEQNQKKRKMNDNFQFSEFLENIEGMDLEGSNKKKKTGKTFL